MTKSYVPFFLGLYREILTDFSAAYPGMVSNFRRDFQRLEKLANSRGDRLFTIDLPSICKELDYSFTIGELSLSSSSLVITGKQKDSRIPRLFGELWMLIFDQSGLMVEDPDVTGIFFLRQILNVSKKIEFDCPDSAVFKATAEYFRIESRMRPYTLNWDEDCIKRTFVSLTDATASNSSLPLCDLMGDYIPSYLDHGLISTLDVVQRTADLLMNDLGDFDPLEWDFRHGRGRVSDAQVGDKYCFPNWPKKLDTMFPLAEFAFVNYSYWIDHLSKDSNTLSIHEPPSRLIKVPKTQKAPRLIASEPTAHQWCQQSVRSFIEHTVPRSGFRNSISFGNQEPNRSMAMRASKDGYYATIDLSSASDRLSLWTVERFFRNSNLLNVFHSVRTRWIVNNIDKKQPQFHKLRKFASQGSALTFPIQTLVYSAAAIGCILSIRELPITMQNILSVGKDVRVFGDDIIVPVDTADVVIQVLQFLGLEVNRDKTFTEGNFRESCGIDAFLGHDVTPGYIKKPLNPRQPESLISNVQVSNNFHMKGLWNTARWLMDQCLALFTNVNIPVISKASGTFGWSSYVGTFVSTRMRWNTSLHMREIQVTTPTGVTDIGNQHGHSSLFQYFTERPSPETNWVHGFVKKSATRLRRKWVPLPD
jgi:hypothetical protein